MDDTDQVSALHMRTEEVIVTTLLASVEPSTAPRGASGERRDITTRALRAAVAAWFGVHPQELATLSADTVDRMALRLEGRRAPRKLDAGDVSATDLVGHPWAG